MRRKFIWAVLFTSLFVLGLALAQLPAREARPQFSAEQFLDTVKALASGEMQGRGNGTPELDRAAVYIARQFRKCGLRPAGDRGTYLQHFTMTVGAHLGPNNSLTYKRGALRKPYAVRDDFVPLSFSAAGSFQGPLVFAGYGITAPESHYDDYQGIDARGKIVIVLRHEPQELDAHSVFAGREFTAHSIIVNKVINARNHGAVGMVLVNDAGNHPEQADELIRFGTLAGPAEVSLAGLQVRASVADAWLEPTGKTLEALRQAIDKDLSNQSMALEASGRVLISVDVERVRKDVANVVGVMPGRDVRLAEQAIVVGAHYDHLGLGDQFSLAPSTVGQVHHGADDNASGTSGVLALACGLARQRPRPAHTLVFAAFAAEEAGLLGSNHYTQHPAVPLERTIAMINLDMIGRIRDRRLYVGGTGTSPAFKSLVEEANRPLGFELSYSASGYGASDHMSFTVREVPVLFFFSGLHSDYHKPSDTWEKIDAAGGVRVVELVADVVAGLDTMAEKPMFVRVSEPAAMGVGGGGGYGPYFGSVPDFGQVDNGVKFADVRDGSPAGKVGFKAGDVLVEFGDKKIENLYDFTYALRAHKPGDKVSVTVLRNGERVTHEVVLEARK